MELSIEVAQRGQVTLPKRLREQYGIMPGQRYTVIDLGGVFVLSPKESQVDALCDVIRDELLDAGATLEDILADIRRMRETDA